MDRICGKCGERPKWTSACELRAMPGMDKRCAFTGLVVEADKEKKD